MVVFGFLSYDCRSKCSVDLINSIIIGASMRDLALDYPRQFLSVGKQIKFMKDTLVAPRHFPMQVIILWGPTGTGKSLYAFSRWPDAFSISHPCGKRWDWPGYDGQETVIYDEWNCQIPIEKFLKWTDRNPFTVWNKGGSSEFVSKRIVFCSNFDPQYWYSDAPFASRAAMNRRFEEFGIIYKLEDRHSGAALPSVYLDGNFDGDDSDDEDWENLFE